MNSNLTICRLNLLFWVICFLPYISSCSPIASFPTGIREFRELVEGNEWAVAAPIERAVASMTVAVIESGFVLERVVCFDGIGEIRASSTNLVLSTSFEMLNANLTRLKVKVRERGSILQEKAVASTLIRKMREALQNGTWMAWLERRDKEAIAVFRERNENAPVIAYIMPGVVVDVVDVAGKWAEIDLVDGIRGFMKTDRLRWKKLTQRP